MKKSEQIVPLKNVGYSAKATTKQLGVDPKTDFNAMTRFNETGSMVRKPAAGEKRDVCHKWSVGIVWKEVSRNLSRIMRKSPKTSRSQENKLLEW